MNIFIIWFCLVTIGQCIHSKVITVNNNGNISHLCCTSELCICASLPQALLSIRNNTVINITSQAIPLHGFVQTSGSNITITSSVGTTIMCNNTGAVSCHRCNNFTIRAIKWDRCGIISEPLRPGIYLQRVSNICIINCTFQHFKVCISVYMDHAEGSVNIANSDFIFNTISNPAICDRKKQFHSSLLVIPHKSTNIIVSDSLFYQNGNTNKITSFGGSMVYNDQKYQPTLSLLITHATFISNGFNAVNIYNTATRSSITLHKVNISDNWFGVQIYMAGRAGINSLDITSSYFVHNHNGTLFVRMSRKSDVNVHNTIFANNIGAFNYILDGSAISFFGYTFTLNISMCKFYDNIGGNNIVYIGENNIDQYPFCNASITSSDFTGNKIGSALKVQQCRILNFYSKTSFEDNSARRGCAIYITEGSQISVGDGATVWFIRNTASLHGGAMYIDLTNCHDHGIVFTNLTRYDSISFINNSAKQSGNSIYFNIPDSCDVVRDYAKNNSAAYAPYKFNYTQRYDTIGPPITASPYEMHICSSAKCNVMKNNTKYVIRNNIMLGQSLYFKPIVYDYFNCVAEATMFEVRCINCELKYRLLEDVILAQNGSRSRIKIRSIAADTDVENDTNIILNISSLLSPEYKQLTTILMLSLSSCDNGYWFSKQSQQCECFNKNSYLKCKEESANIKLGYWFGVYTGKHIIALCHNDYCNFFTNRKETSSGFYNLKEEVDDQCSSYRTGIACGQCSEGYTLAYNSPDCVNVSKCSPGMILLVVAVTVLYWIVIIAILFGVAYFLNAQQVSLGYLYGIIFFYSVVDILLVSKLHLTDGMFYTITILSSFAKFYPQFLGRLCFIKNMDAIDQQFIHYCHVVFISVILLVIYIIAKCNNTVRALVYVNRCIVQVTSFVLLFSYTSLTSTSLLLLRAVKFDDNDGLHIYLSPHLKYFANRHAVYAGVAVLWILIVTIGVPLLLVTEPLMMKLWAKCLNNNTQKRLYLEPSVKKRSVIKVLVNQLQDCYKDQHRWFAAYYLICRLVIMLITSFANNDYNYMIYYLQTACAVIAMTHIWFQPYKNHVLNVKDTIILLIMLLIVNLNSISFSKTTTTGIAISLIIAPLLLLFGIAVKKLQLVSRIKKFLNNFGRSIAR